jgi:hypothetical protein
MRARIAVGLIAVLLLTACSMTRGSGQLSSECDLLDVQMSGSGTLTYSGNPKQVTQEISGSAKLIKR